MAVVVIGNTMIAVDSEGFKVLFWLIPGLGLFSAWNILPHILYFNATRKIYSYYLLLPPAILLCSVQLFFIISYFTSLSSTSALIFIFAPIYEGIVLAFGFLLGFLIEKIKKNLTKQSSGL